MKINFNPSGPTGPSEEISLVEFSQNLKQTKVTILGDGSWAIALKNYLIKNNNQVKLWGIRENLNCSTAIDFKDAVEFGDYIIVAIPSLFFRSIIKRIKQENCDIAGKIFVSVAKGIEPKTSCRMSEIIEMELGVDTKIAVLSGPTLAHELTKTPTMAIVASERTYVAIDVQHLFYGNDFKVEISKDIIGVELAGAMKNVLAIAHGISYGLEKGANTGAFIFSKGLDEMVELGLALGARRETFSGLAGVGDMFATFVSSGSRNSQFGKIIGRGKNIKFAKESITGIAEGETTAEALLHLGRIYHVKMPIVSFVYNVLYNKKNPKKELERLWNSF